MVTPFNDMVGCPFHNIPSPGLLMKRNGAEFLQSDALPGASQVGCNIYTVSFKEIELFQIVFCQKIWGQTFN